MSNTSSILVTGDDSGIGKARARDWSSYLTGSDRLQARGPSRLWVKAVMALIALTAMAAAMFAVPSPAHAAPASTKLIWVSRAGYRIAAFVHPGRGPAIVLCHGFPDNHHLYDSVVPLLKGHEVVSFDFLGWGQSSKPAHYDYTFAGQEQDLNAVIQGLHLGKVVLVAHDASVPAVLNWALEHRVRPLRSSFQTASTRLSLEAGRPLLQQSSRLVSIRTRLRSDHFRPAPPTDSTV
jgi:hypothetical protein